MRIFEVELKRTTTTQAHAILEITAKDEESARKLALEMSGSSAVIWSVSVKQPETVEANISVGSVETILDLDEEIHHS
jgi:hypothetical protein